MKATEAAEFYRFIWAETRKAHLRIGSRPRFVAINPITWRSCLSALPIEEQRKIVTMSVGPDIVYGIEVVEMPSVTEGAILPLWTEDNIKNIR